jgi:hypothetical protein
MSAFTTTISTAKLRMGAAAAAAVLATATLTPAIAEATPSVDFAPISQGLGSTAVEWIAPFVVDSSAPGDASNAAAVVPLANFQPFAIIDGIVKFFANVVYESLNFIGDVFILAANAIGRIFQVGPYAV